MTETILTQRVDTIFYITLNRSTKNNAFNAEMITALTTVFKQVNVDKQNIRFIYLTGAGEHFCAGADLRWMHHCAKLNKEQNYAEAEKLYNLYLAMQQCSAPIIAEVKGSIMGGGVGLCAASDIVLAETGSTFALSETQRGIIPAIMLPVLLRKMHASRILELLMTGREFSARDAMQFGLIQFVSLPSEIQDNRQRLFEQLESTAPTAVSQTKRLLNELTSSASHIELEQSKTLLIKTLAESRASLEAQEGIAAFFSKRKPQWNTSNY